MNGAQNGTAGSGSGAEDLDVVIQRFQNWSKSQRKKSPSTTAADSGPAPKAPWKKTALEGGSRELSYEQALRVSRHRRPLQVEPDLAKSEPDRGPRASRGPEAEDSFAAQVPPQAMQTDAIQPAPAARRPEARAISAAGAGPPAHPPIKSGIPPNNAHTPVPAPIKQSARSPVGAPAAKSTADGQPGDIRLPESRQGAPVPAGAVSRASVGRGRQGKSSRPNTIAKTPRREAGSEPAFRDVLTAAAVAVTPPTIPSPPDGTKSTSLALRVSDEEQARIQAGAARASLSVSAYLRQCALGVDELRQQVDLALSELQTQRVLTASPPGISAIPGILGRFAAQCLRRFGWRSAGNNSLSLR